MYIFRENLQNGYPRTFNHFANNLSQSRFPNSQNAIEGKIQNIQITLKKKEQRNYNYLA